MARLELRGHDQPAPELRPEKGSGVGWDEGMDGQHEGSVGFDGCDRRLEGARTAVGHNDVFADDRGPVFLPAAGGHCRPAAAHRREGEVGDNLGHVFHADHHTCGAWSPVVRRGSNARKMAVKRSARLARSELRSALVKVA